MKALYAVSASLLILAACGEEELPWPRTYAGKVSWTYKTYKAQWGVQESSTCGPSEAFDSTITVKQDGTLTIVATLPNSSAAFDQDGAVSMACSYEGSYEIELEGRYTATDDGGGFEVSDDVYKWAGTFNDKGIQGTLTFTRASSGMLGYISGTAAGTFSGDIQ